MSGFIPDRFAQHGGSPVDPSLPDPKSCLQSLGRQYDPIFVLYVDYIDIAWHSHNYHSLSIYMFFFASSFSGSNACSERHYITGVALPSILSIPRSTRQVRQLQAKDWIGCRWGPFSGGIWHVLAYVPHVFMLADLAEKWWQWASLHFFIYTLLYLSFDIVWFFVCDTGMHGQLAKAKHADAVLFLCAFHSQLLMWHNLAGVYRLTFKSFYEERSRWGHKSTFILHLWIETRSPEIASWKLHGTEMGQILAGAAVICVLLGLSHLPQCLGKEDHPQGVQEWEYYIPYIYTDIHIIVWYIYIYWLLYHKCNYMIIIVCIYVHIYLFIYSHICTYAHICLYTYFIYIICIYIYIYTHVCIYIYTYNL